MKDFSAIPAVPAVAGLRMPNFELQLRNDDEKVIVELRVVGVVEIW